jgi:hypothetical protein
MGKDIAAIKDSITHSGEFRVHLIHARSGMRTTCRMWHHDGCVMGVANGCGCDKAGAALGRCIEALFAEELKGLTPHGEWVPAENMDCGPIYRKSKDGLYGLSKHMDGKMSLDGSCGLECMLAVLVALGFTDAIRYGTGKLSSMVLARKATK